MRIRKSTKISIEIFQHKKLTRNSNEFRQVPKPAEVNKKLKWKSNRRERA